MADVQNGILLDGAASLEAALDAAAYLGGTLESNDRVSPVETASDPDFLPMSVPLNDRQIAHVQAILAEHDLYKGDIDGIAGPQTQAAAAAFREATGLSGGAAVDVGLARALVERAAPRAMTPGTGPVSPNLDSRALDLDQNQVRRRQTALKAREQGPGDPDDIAGGKTRTAVRNDGRGAGPEPEANNSPDTAMASRYVSPVTGTWAAKGSSPFKARRRASRRSGYAYRQHSGNDLQAANGSPAVAVIGGKVIYAGHNKGYQWNAVVLGDDGNAYRYATHGPLSVNYGDRVEQGEKVGEIGRSHLHFEIIPQGSPIIQQQLNAGNTFVSTSWYPGKAAPTLDPAAFFGASRGAKVTAGKPVGDTSKMAFVPTDGPGADPFGVHTLQRPEPPETSAALDAAAYLGDGPQAANTASPVPMLQDPSFLPMKTEPLDPQQVADVQAILAEQGYDPGPLDGIIGPRTEAAAASFRQGRGLDGAGVDIDLARSLVDTRSPPVGEPAAVEPTEPMNRPEDYIRDPEAGRETLPMLRPEGGAMNPPIPRNDPRRPELIPGPMPMPRVNPMRPSRMPEPPRLNPRRPVMTDKPMPLPTQRPSLDALVQANADHWSFSRLRMPALQGQTP